MLSVSIFLVIAAKYQQNNVNKSKTNFFRLEYMYKSLYTSISYSLAQCFKFTKVINLIRPKLS